MNNKEIARILRKAAQLIGQWDNSREDNELYCCTAISRTVRPLRDWTSTPEIPQDHPVMSFFRDLYLLDSMLFTTDEERRSNPLGIWWNHPAFPGSQEPRILALLLAADVAESGGL